MQKIMLLDGNNLMFRAFYALPMMETSDGRYINAVYGFMSMLIRLLGTHKPDRLGVAFDLYGPTFRHAQFAQYKAGRKPTPSELIPQFDILKELLNRIGIGILQAESFEADDILGTLSVQATEYGLRTLLVSGDRDIFQLITPSVAVLYANHGVTDVDILDEKRLLERFGYSADRVTDLKALMGDASDNIPGIPGVGEKTAMNLIAHFNTLEDILQRPEEVLKGAMLTKVRNGAESARVSKMLATIRRDAPVNLNVSPLILPELTRQEVYDALLALEMPSLVERLRHTASAHLYASLDGEESRRASWPDICELRTKEAVDAFLLPTGPIALTIWPEIEVAVRGVHARLCLKRDLLSEGFEEEAVYAVLRKILSDRHVYYYDRKSVCRFLEAHSIHPPAALDDAMIMGYLLYKMDVQESLSPLAEKVFGQGGDGAAVLYDLCESMHTLLSHERMEMLYRQIEMPLIDVLYDMEREGFELDSVTLQNLGTEYERQITALRAEIYKLAGEKFNILSSKQLSEILFVKMGLPPQKKTKFGFSTDSSVLEMLEHPIAAKILEYRGLTKLKSTYVDGLLAVIGEDGRVHTTFHQTLTATGRISSAEPNLQNIPIKTDFGRIIRRAFIPRGTNHLLIDADYSQIELRVLAHMSGDPNMQEAYRLGQDIHQRTAAEIYGVTIGQVTPRMRSSAKAVNFGVVYGISEFGLARNTGITRAEARNFMDMYFDRYPLVRQFMDNCVAKGKAEGFVSTLMGRRRYLPELSSPNYNTRSFGERAAMNTPIQGTAADIIKLAMIRVAQALSEADLSAKLILQVHDELIVDAPKEEVDRVCIILRREMEGAAQLSVPLEVDIHVGATWEAAK